MKRSILILMTLIASVAFPILAQEVPDTILLNGKIVTVDYSFSTQQAIAIQGELITAIGSNETIEALAGPDTRKVDLEGRTVIPGLIDNHLHMLRATEYWPNEARLDGVSSRAEALEILKSKADSMSDGEWLMTLGGWTENQFADSRADFTLAELDAVAPDRPAFLQSTYDHALVNSVWLNQMDIAVVGEASSGEGLASHVLRDDAGNATGRLNGGISMVAKAIQKFPSVSPERQIEAIKSAFTYLNSIGLTGMYDPGGVGINEETYNRIHRVAEESGLTVRVFHTLFGGAPSTPEQAQEIVEQIENARGFQGNQTIDRIGIGEIYYTPFHWDSLFDAKTPTAEDITAAKGILIAAAKGGWQLQTHASQPGTIKVLLDVMEEVNAEYPLRQLRWSVTHGDLVDRKTVERMKHMGMNLQLRSVSVLTQPRRYRLIEEMGEAAYDVPPLRMVQNSGIPYGLGTDGTKATQINPFVSLWWAVSGRALNGDLVLKQTLSREDALIAHTRSNSYLMFQENYTGSLRPGLLADMVVLDRDYMTVPVDEIREIKPVATIVGGDLVWGQL